MFSLERAWNCNMRLKSAVRRASADGISKQTVVNFWKASAKKLGYWGSYPVAKFKSNPLSQPTEDKSYTDWKGTTGAGLLLSQIINGVSK